MKKTFVFFYFFGIITFANAQSKMFWHENLNFSSQKVTAAGDTLTPPSFTLSCYNNQNTLYYADKTSPHDSGYVTGNNIYGDLEKAQLYLNTNTITITGCLALVSKKASGTPTVTSVIKIYSKGSNGKPASLLATSQPKTQSSLINNSYNTFIFSSPLTVSGAFFVSYVLPRHFGDSTGIYSTSVTCHSTSSLAFEMAADSTWGTIKTNWGLASTNDLDLVLLPLTTNLTTGLVSHNQSNISWNCAANELVFKSLPDENYAISIIDLQGRIIQRSSIVDGAVDVSALKQNLFCFVLCNDKGNFYRGKFIKE